MLSFRKLSALVVVAIIAIILAHVFFQVNLLWIILPMCFWLLMVSIGSFSMRYNFFLKSITHIDTSEKKIAITFDDGPNTNYTLPVLKLLDKYNAKATFFCIGKHIKKYPEIAKTIADKGHNIGNHSYSHNNFIGFSSVKKWKEEIEQTDALIKNITKGNTGIFRPPFGVTTPNLAKVIKTSNHNVIGWNIRSFDTVIRDKSRVLNRITKRIKPGGIVLLHDTQPNTLYILEHLLLYLKQNNYEAVTINNLLNDY